MRRPWHLALGLLLPLTALAAPSGSSSPPAASARPPAGSASALPAGHPPVGSALPPGHPPTGSASPPDPHGLPPGHPTTGQADNSGRFRMPLQSRAQEDPGLPPGTIAIEVRDGDGKPLASQEVTLGIIENSVAKGESRQRRVLRTDEAGQVRASGLDTSSSFAYRVSTSRSGATYAAAPFNLPQEGGGMRVSLFAYPVTTDVAEATVAAQAITYLELRDEVIQVEMAYRVYNLGSTTWLATDVAVALPQGFKAFNSQRAMSDLAWDGTEQGARFHGTLSPGVHDTAFRFQVPYPSGDEATIELGILPNVQAFRVLSDAPRGLELEADGFPQPTATTNGNGQRVLVTEKEMPRLDPSFRRVRIHLSGLPTKPRGRWYALGISVAAIAIGLFTALRLRAAPAHDPEELRQARKRILDELAQLEKDHAAGDVGPRTYEAARRSLLDALARLLQQGEAAPR